MPEHTSVDRLYEEFDAGIARIPNDVSTISVRLALADNFRKCLLLASASYFEHQICQTIERHVAQRSPGSELILNFVKNKAIARQYHTWFNWKDSNANQFFGLFGANFKATVDKRVKADNRLQQAIRAFMQIGNERNQLVHGDYASYPLEKTHEEIYASYKEALYFVEIVPTLLIESDPVPRIE